MHQVGAEIAMTYLNDRARPFVEPLAQAVGAPIFLPLEVREKAQVDAVFDTVAARWGRRLDILIIRSLFRRERRWPVASSTARATAF